MMSSTALMTRLATPPKNPAQTPSVEPISVATRTAPMPAVRETLAPTTSRERMSRPISSVPRRCPSVNGGAAMAA